MQKIDEFITAHRKLYGQEIITNALLKTNLKELVNNKRFKVSITSRPNIIIHTGCVVKGVDFGEFRFDFKIYNGPSRRECRPSCTSKLRKTYFLAPHISSHGVCFGEHFNPLRAALKSCDYALAGQVLGNFFDSMNKNSHYYYDALYSLLEHCAVCDETINPYIYRQYDKKGKHVKSENILYCDKCNKIAKK